jgi:hypothetical protein
LRIILRDRALALSFSLPGGLMKNLLRVSRIMDDGSIPWKRSTCYKLKHLNRYPGLFIKLGGQLFIDLNVMEQIIEEGRTA